MLGIVIFFKTIFWQWHIIFRNKVVIFNNAMMIFYQIFFPISVKQQHVTPIKTTTLYLKILLDSDWKAKLTDKNKTLCRDWLCGQFPDQQRDILPVLCTTMPYKHLLLKLQCNTSIFYLNYSATQVLHQYKERGNVLCSSTIVYATPIIVYGP